MARPGHPPRYKSKEEIEEKIEQYFDYCKGHVLEDEDGKPVTDKNGQTIIVDVHPPTVTGLALALGFTTRQSLLNYQAKAEFEDVITRAKSRVEAYAEERLFYRDSSNGAQFSLRNNFKGWNGENDKSNDTVTILKNMQTMYDILKKPAEDRDITDYED